MYRIANTWWSRMKGRLGEIKPSKPLYIPRCNCVHTFGMAFPLHLTWYDKQRSIIREQQAIPNRVYFCPGASSVLESHLSELPTKDYRLHANISGQALVEAAFALPILLLIIFGFIQIGLAVHAAQRLHYATHYATQVGSITNDINKVSGAIEEFFDPTEFSLLIESRDIASNIIPNSARQRNHTLTVTVEHPFRLQIPLVSISALSLQAQASARILCANNQPPYTCND